MLLTFPVSILWTLLQRVIFESLYHCAIFVAFVKDQLKVWSLVGIMLSVPTPTVNLLKTDHLTGEKTGNTQFHR